MDTLFFAVLAGITVTMQSSVNGLLTPLIGPLGVSFLGAVIQSVLLLLFLAIRKKDRPDLSRVPWTDYSGGLFGVIIVGLMGVCVSKLGSSVTTCCSVAGQILMSAVSEHFGLFGNSKNRFSMVRLPGFILILAGVLSMNLIGAGSASETPLPFLLLGLLLGAGAIIVRSLNYHATKASGSSLGGGLVNSLSGAFFGLILLLITTGFHPQLSGLKDIPVWYMLGGVFGTVCLLSNILAYRRQQIFYSTIFMLIGQVVTGIIMDLLVFHSLSAGKCIGIAIVLAGVFLDKLLTREKPKS